MLALLQSLEWIVVNNHERCPVCGRIREFGHSQDCRMQAVLSRPAGSELKNLRRENKALRQELARREGIELMKGGREKIGDK